MTDIKPVQWEYRLEEFGGYFKHSPKVDELSALLNEWGEEGWDVISAVYSENSTRWRIIAKRPLSAAIRRQRTMPGLDAVLG
jgi:hypothetical protein